MKIRSADILRSAGYFMIKAGMLRNIILVIIREGNTVGSKDSAPTAGFAIQKIFSVITEEKSTKEICRPWKNIQYAEPGWYLCVDTLIKFNRMFTSEDGKTIHIWNR